MTNFLQPLFDRFVGKRNEVPVHVAEKKPSIPKTPKRVRKVLPSKRGAGSPDTQDGLVHQLKSSGRYVALLMPQIASNLRMGQLVEVVELLGCEMSRIPAGPVAVEFPYLSEPPTNSAQIYQENSFLIDRFAVTNAEYKVFVDEGCYESKELWDSTVASVLSQFVDETGKPGPSGWKNGCIPKGLESHPVVGISWHEAAAYARWVGKRLPTRAEWVKAASWPLVSDTMATDQRAFPWGDVFDGSRANVWVTGLQKTVPVDEFQNGNTRSDVCQMCGNVWEWIADDFQIFSSNTLVSTEDSIKALRGGAFDTYIEDQASCQFESGDHAFARKPNIGFRCATSAFQFADEVQELVERLTDLPVPTTLPVTSTPHDALNEPSDDDQPDDAVSPNDSKPTEQVAKTRDEKNRRTREVLEDRLQKWTSVGRGGKKKDPSDSISGKKNNSGADNSGADKSGDDKPDADKPYKSPFAGPGF